MVATLIVVAAAIAAAMVLRCVWCGSVVERRPDAGDEDAFWSL